MLEAEVELLESSRIITENVTKQLANEIDRLSQYTRRSNVIVRNVFEPEKETNEEVFEKMIKLIEKYLSLPHLVNEIDKLHRVGNVKEMNGKIS